VKPNAAQRTPLPIVVLLLASCGTSETDCREGIADLHRKLGAIVGSEFASSAPAVREELNTAKERRDAGDYAGCIDAIGRGRAAIVSSQRTNQ
jgi:hypothetical protein